MNNNISKFLMAGILILIVAFSAIYLNITGFSVIETENIVDEKTIDVEVWANSYIELETQRDMIIVESYLDNGTLIEQAEAELYIDNQKLNSLNKSLFNLSEINPGTYTLEIGSQGSSSQYISESSIEKEINIDENGNIKFTENIKNNEDTQEIQEPQETNTTENNVTQEIVQKESLENCESFSENVLWSSGYSKDESSINHHAWNLNETCSNCFITNIELKTRFLSSANETQQKEGYVQISNPSQENFCENPEQGTYEKYLAYDTLKGESKRLGFYKQGNQTLDFNSEGCYGIKLYADQNFLVDVFGIKYDLCTR